MDIKHKEISRWLKEIYGGDEIPDFEKSERSIEILYDLMKKNKSNNTDCKLMSKDFEKKTSEYDAQGETVRTCLNTLDIKPEQLDSNSQKILSSLCYLQHLMHLDQPTATNVLLGINQCDNTHSNNRRDIEIEKKRMETLLSINQSTVKNISELQKIHEACEVTAQVHKSENEKEAKRKNFNLAKIEEYKSDIKIYEAKLNNVGYKSELSHDNLCKKAKDVESLENQVKELEEKLARYTLPPDIKLAEAKVEETRQKHNNLIKNIAAVYDHN